MRECGRFEQRNEPQEKEVAGSDEQREISSARSLRMREMASRTRGENQTYTEEAALLLIRREGERQLCIQLSF